MDEGREKIRLVIGQMTAPPSNTFSFDICETLLTAFYSSAPDKEDGDIQVRNNSSN